ncbi:hypothetical protein BT93_G2348 [Corymbia citriodora subsp. variegata]|nr:hypothetical protein BT93_G2348 [Corymbia citriodora subsp. variegata]
MAAPAKLSCPLHCIALLALLCLVESAALGRGGFTADLIHRDSLSSLSHDPSATHSNLMRGVAQRSISRTGRIWARLGSKIRSDLTAGEGAYYVKAWIGDPPLETLLSVDTGSDLTWTQCKPCINCYKQKPPIFVPGNSRTYRAVKWGTKECDSVRRIRRGGEDDRYCTYNYKYLDGSITEGDVAMETFTIGTPPGAGAIPPVRIAFGCGYNNRGIFEDIGSGILGLGRDGQFSLISQMEGSIHGLFGYCLVPPFGRGSSKISFGEDAVVSGPGAISTPLVPGSPYYTVNLEGFSIGETRFSYGDNSTESEAKESNKAVEMIIDSGSTLTFLPPQYFHNLERAIRLPKVPDPERKFHHCYRIPDHEIKVPDVTLHFAGGADMALKRVNILPELRENLMCLPMEPMTNKMAVLGYKAQWNFKVGFNLGERTVSFKPITDCSAERIDMI